jgi:hypothetical protein
MGFTRAFFMLHDRDQIFVNYQFILYIVMSEDASSNTVVCVNQGLCGSNCPKGRREASDFGE